MRQKATQFGSTVGDRVPQPNEEGRSRDIIAEKIGMGSGRTYDRAKHVGYNKTLYPMKMARCIVELERIYNIKEGRPEILPNYSVVNQKQLAEQIGTSKRTTSCNLIMKPRQSDQYLNMMP